MRQTPRGREPVHPRGPGPQGGPARHRGHRAGPGAQRGLPAARVPPGRRARPWDGVWHLAAFAVPESARTARDALRETLVRLGGAPLQGGLYVCANAWEPYVEDAAHRLGAHDTLTLLSTTDLRRGDVREPAGLARRLWPLEEVADRYHRLARVARPRLDRLTGPAELSPSELLTITVELAAELTRAMDPDPLLPPELLPRPWPGAQARELVARCWTALRERDHGGARPALFRLHTDLAREAAHRTTG